MRPRLLRLASGPLLLTGGRLCPTLVGNGTRFPAQSCPPTSGGGKGGNYVWLNADGMADAAGGGDGSEWQVQCVTEQHNAGWNGSSNWRFTGRRLGVVVKESCLISCCLAPSTVSVILDL